MAEITQRRQQIQHTVRFRDAREGAVLAMMASSAGVSVSEWVATAARQRMHSWLRSGWDGVLSDEIAEALRADLEAAVAHADDVLEDLPILKPVQRGN
jgi:hypothetical protein